MVEVIAGYAFAILLAGSLRQSGKSVGFKLVSALAVFLLCIVMVETLKEGLADFWMHRIGETGKDSRVLSLETIRGMDNLASISAIWERPWYGWGIPCYPEWHSLRPDSPTDIHSMLMMGLIGGIPLIFLTLRLQWVLVRKFWTACRHEPAAQKVVLPYVAVLTTTMLVINLIGTWGTLTGRGLMVMCIFIGLLAAEFAAVPGLVDTEDISHLEGGIPWQRLDPPQVVGPRLE
jgi:O-antigen ligase